MTTPTCPGCGEPSGGRYCPSCGQPIDVDPRSLGHWLREAFEEVLSLDGRLLRSLWAIVTRPGFLTIEWRAGRRSSWTSPFRLYLLTSVTFFTASLVFPLDGEFSVNTEVIEDLALENAVEAAQERALGTVAPQVLIVLVPLLALILRAVFGGRLYYVEHLVHAVHLQSFFLILLLVVYLGPVIPEAVAPYLALAFLVTLFGYSARSCARVYGHGPVRTGLSVALGGLVYVMLTLIVLGAVVSVVAADPRDALVEAEESYWRLKERWAAGDSSAASERAQAVAVRFRRLESHLLGAEAMAHAAEMLAAGDSVRDARLIAEQALVRSPEDALLLAVAGDVAGELGDSAAARRYAERLLRAPDPDSVDARNAPELEGARARAAALLGRDRPGG